VNTIFIHDFRVATRVGVYEWERHTRQTVRLDLEIGIADDAAFASGEFADALDYAAVVDRLRSFAATNPHALLERFAQAIADLVLAEFRASWVKVRVAKPNALPGVREVGVAIERSRG
jgi:7,8-dihydroneopterin aldolase/epimerase/oxygenase